MQKNPKVAVTLRLVLSVLLIGFVVSCEDPGSVGSGIIPQPSLRFDTLLVDGFSKDSLIGSTGNLEHVSIGNQSDPLFGEIASVGYFKPSLDFNLDTTLNDAFNIQLKLDFDSTLAYGDTLSSANFSLYEITQNWRGNELLANTEIPYSLVDEIASFTTENRSSVTISLPDAWKDEFAVFVNDTTSNKDSLYINQFFGFAIVQTNNSQRISSVVPSTSRFLLINNVDDDTTQTRFGSWGYSYTRQGESSPSGRYNVHNTLERFLKINLSDIAKDVDQQNLVRAELVIHADSKQLSDNLLIGSNRPNVNLLNLFFDLGISESYDLQFSQPNAFGIFDDDAEVYRFDITRLVEEFAFNGLEDRVIYLTPSSVTGTFRSTTLFDSSAQGFEPKLIITSVENSQ